MYTNLTPKAKKLSTGAFILKTFLRILEYKYKFTITFYEIL